jgi:hypothetical protein
LPRFEIRASFPLVAKHGGMNDGKSIFSQLIGFLPDREFRRCVARYEGDRYTKKLFCWEQFLAMAFAQLVYRESLRDIEACLGAIGPKLYHMDLGSAVARSTWSTPTRTAIGASLLTLRRWKRAKGCYPSGHSAKYLA